MTNWCELSNSKRFATFFCLSCRRPWSGFQLARKEDNLARATGTHQLFEDSVGWPFKGREDFVTLTVF